jgi:hypothetical protein
MDLTLYHLITHQLTDPPDLSIIDQKHPVPENWPVVLEGLQTFRKKILGFTVTDGKRSVYCISNLPEVYDRVASLEAGIVIHLIGAETIYDDARKSYILDIQSVLTLKEYDDHLKLLQKEEMERLARLREQDFLDTFTQQQLQSPE